METKTNSNAFQRLVNVSDAIVNSEIEEWKENGNKVVGYFCSSMPVEIVTAAGMLAFRLRATGNSGTELSDSFFSSINCSFPRNAFNVALKGGFYFIDGLVMFNSCDHIRRVYDHWIRQMNTPFVKILSLPKKADPLQIDWFKREIQKLIKEMEEHFEVNITVEKLREAIKIHNESRRLLRSLYELRKSENPPVTGAETLALTVASTAIPAEVYNKLLKEALEDIRHTDGNNGHRARLMILGGELDNPKYIKVIEDQGGLVVTDSLCFGSRLLWKDIDENSEDPLSAIAKYYVAERPSCARMYTEYEKRSEYIMDMIKAFNVDGAIFERLAFCEIWGFEQYSLINDFKEHGVPLLCMDREYELSGVGQLKTRVQAFLETIGG